MNIQAADPNALAILLQEAFSFLITRPGWRCVREAGGAVRFESAKVYLSIQVDPASPEELRFSFGPKRGAGHIKDAYETIDLGLFLDPGNPELERCLRPPADHGLIARLGNLRSVLLRPELASLLSGAPSAFDRLSVARRERRAVESRELSRRLAEQAAASCAAATGEDAKEDEDEFVCLGSDPGRGRAALDAARLAELEHLEHESSAMLQATFVPMKPSDPWMERLRPHYDHYLALFPPEALEVIEIWYDGLWNAGMPPPEPRPGQDRLRLTACWSDWLGQANDLARRFPDGYRQVSSWLLPGAAWVVWRYVGGGDLGGPTYDGLVWVNHEWIWLPEPWQPLSCLPPRD